MLVYKTESNYMGKWKQKTLCIKAWCILFRLFPLLIHVVVNKEQIIKSFFKLKAYILKSLINWQQPIILHINISSFNHNRSIYIWLGFAIVNGWCLMRWLIIRRCSYIFFSFVIVRFYSSPSRSLHNYVTIRVIFNWLTLCYF